MFQKGRTQWDAVIIYQKRLQKNQAAEILREINGFSDIKQATFSSGMDYLEIEAKGQDYSEVMSRAVNIFSKKQTDVSCHLHVLYNESRPLSLTAKRDRASQAPSPSSLADNIPSD